MVVLQKYTGMQGERRHMDKNEIVILHGTDYQQMAFRLMREIDLQGDIGARSLRIGIKPNLVLDAPASDGATTHPELVAGVIEYLRQEGFENLIVLEGSWVGAKTSAAYVTSGLRDVCERYGVPFVDLQRDSARSYHAFDMDIRVCDQAMALDYLINMPVLKGHCQTGITCALKNAKGLIPNTEKRRFHSMGLHRPIANLNTLLPRGLVLVDNICGDLDFEEGGNPVTMNRIFCCKDPVLCDSFVCQSMGYRVDEVEYIGLAERMGVGCADLSRAKITALNESSAAPQQSTRQIRRLASYAAPDSACSACYGSLIYALHKLEQEYGPLELPQKIAIGQGYQGKTGETGVGRCTCGFRHTVSGCPPTAADICDFLRSEVLR